MYPFPCVPSCCLELRQIKKSTQTPHPKHLRCAAHHRRQRGAGAGLIPPSERKGAAFPIAASAEFKRPQAPRRDPRAPPKAVGHRRSPAARPPRRRTGRSQARQHRSRRVRQGDCSAVPGRVLRARAEEARWGVNFQLHLLPVRIMCEDKCRTYQRFLDEQTASSLSLRHLRTVTRPAFRSEPGGSRHCDGDTGLAIAKHRDGCVVPERRWAARISACGDYLKTAAALRGVAGPVALWAGGREAAGGISRL